MAMRGEVFTVLISPQTLPNGEKLTAIETRVLAYFQYAKMIYAVNEDSRYMWQSSSRIY